MSDFSKKMTKDFGFLMEKESDKFYGIPLRGVVIANEQGIIRHV